MLKIGMIGAGFVAEFHRKALVSVRDVQLAGVSALKGAEQLAARAKNAGLGDTKVFADVKQLCRAVDVVAVFVPNFARLETLQAIDEAVAEGARLKGIIFEKPLARNLKEADAMVALARKMRVPTAYFENQIHMPPVVCAREQLAAVEKAMGPIHLTRSAEEHGGPHEPWFWDPTRQGGGVWCDMGCHSAAVGMYMLTPVGKAPNSLQCISVSANMGLLKWGKQPWIDQLRQRGVDYDKTPAEDYAVVTLTFKDPRTGAIGIAQATDSWMYDAPGLRLMMEAYGAGYSYTVNSLQSPSGLFISDAAALAVQDAELALEKSQASRGALVMQHNEADLYGYVGEWRDALAAFEAGQDALLNIDFGRLVTQLIMAGYLSHERRKAVDMTDPATLKELDSYIPLIQQGKGTDLLRF